MHSNDPPPRRSERCQTGREIERENLRQQDARSNPRLPAPSRCRVLKNISFGCFFIRQGYYFVISRIRTGRGRLFFLDLDIFVTSLLRTRLKSRKTLGPAKVQKKQVLLASSKDDDVHKTRLFFFRLLFLSLSLLLSKRAEFCVGHEDPPRSWSCSSREGWANASGRG